MIEAEVFDRHRCARGGGDGIQRQPRRGKDDAGLCCAAALGRLDLVSR